ncbi:MAG: toll/interleukin-1 receptor domain-containing protein [Syntrophobacteraceae bacterium]|jgi:hypothetical protein
MTIVEVLRRFFKEKPRYGSWDDHRAWAGKVAEFLREVYGDTDAETFANIYDKDLSVLIERQCGKLLGLMHKEQMRERRESIEQTPLERPLVRKPFVTAEPMVDIKAKASLLLKGVDVAPEPSRAAIGGRSMLMNPKCFISYSWDSDTHKQWVRKLGEELRRNAVDVALDQWDLRLGMDLLAFMETSIRESNFVLLVCTPAFAVKANTASGGVGYEKGVVSGEIFNKVASEKKFIPILRYGDPGNALPSYLQSKLYVDFRNDADFPAKLEELLRHIYDSPAISKPSLGSTPYFASVSGATASVKGRIYRDKVKGDIMPKFREIKAQAGWTLPPRWLQLDYIQSLNPKENAELEPGIKELIDEGKVEFVKSAIPTLRLTKKGEDALY